MPCIFRPFQFTYQKEKNYERITEGKRVQAWSRYHGVQKTRGIESKGAGNALPRGRRFRDF